MERLSEIERRWQQHWGPYEAEPRRPASWMATFPYSYMNSLGHVGHGYTLLRNEVTARFHRMLGEDALFPFGYHMTGTPIVAAAQRVEAGEPTMLRILREQDIPESQIAKFADPKAWADYFPHEWKKDVERLGVMVDWRRSFMTTELNPYYDAFIRWQYTRLRELGYVRKGSHPVIWCPKDNTVVSDHDRHEGEGVAPQEWVLYKMRLQHPERVRVSGQGAAPLSGDVFLIAATLRPDTVFGQTNVWVDARPDYLEKLSYAVCRKGSETWIVAAPAARDHLPYQFDDFEGYTDRRGTVYGRDLVGHLVQEVGADRWIPVLPARFIRPEKGTGIVTSVPSDSPQDLLSLRAVADGRITDDPRVQQLARAIQIIPVIRTRKYATDSAAAAVAEAGATDDQDAARIEAATELAYNAGFYEGVMLDNAGEFAGLPVQQAKDKIRAWLLQRGAAVVAYWPADRVVCRCLTPCVVKVVKDQWFLAYGDAAWKERARAVLAQCRIVPEEARVQFENTIGWLKDWACAREQGLGTRLPWDERWVIESLSDSTIYMAYYTFSHLLEGQVPAEDVRGNLALFDYVISGKGSARDAARGQLTTDRIEKMRREFLHWYPLKFRNSGKDLVQNHLTFVLFHHAALFPPEHWPKAIGVNGWITVDGEKMSKSRGNFVTLRKALDDYGTSAVRLALFYAGEGLDDANFEREFAARVRVRALQWLDAVTAPHETRTGPLGTADRWFLTVVNGAISECTQAMHDIRTRTAVSRVLFDLPRAWDRYLQRVATPHADCHAAWRSVMPRLLSPLAPHVAEEAWNVAGGNGAVLDAPWPSADEAPADPAAVVAESLVDAVLADVREVIGVTGAEPKAVRLFVAAGWKRNVLGAVQEAGAGGRVDPGRAIKRAIELEPQRRKEIPSLVQQLAKLAPGQPDFARRAEVDELALLEEARPYLERALGVPVEAHPEDAAVDSGGRASKALPTRPAIFLAT